MIGDHLLTNFRGKNESSVLRVVGDVATAFHSTLRSEDRLRLEVGGTDGAMPSLVYSVDEREDALHDFETLAAADALSTLADEIEAHCARQREAMYRKALEVYYVAEELSRDPERADLRAELEKMRHAHEQQYGKPIPPKRADTK